jgi:hypothetical protein
LIGWRCSGHFALFVDATQPRLSADARQLLMLSPPWFVADHTSVVPHTSQASVILTWITD